MIYNGGVSKEAHHLNTTGENIMSTKLKSKSSKARTAYLGAWKKNNGRPNRPTSIKLFVGARVGMTEKGASSVYDKLKNMLHEDIQAAH